MRGYLLIMLYCVVTNCTAEFLDDGKSTRDVGPRKGKHDLLFSRKADYSEIYFSPLHSGIFGGLHGLVAFVILKIKIVLVLITIIGGALLALKFFGLFKYSNYVYKSNYPIIDSPPAYEYANYPQAFTNDHKLSEEFPTHYGEIERSDSQDFINEFFIKIEEILHPLMNFDNKNCRERSVCQVAAILGYSSFSECRSLYPSCIEEKTTGEHTGHREIR